ncbi:MAG: hypothetical protein JWQ48_2178 [Conexibacter sp.]|nr:hypothetical protein [Conexibacter sp.]
MSLHISERFAAGWSSRDPERFATLFTDDCLYEDIPLGVAVRGRSEIATHLRNWLASSSDIVMTPMRTFDAGERVALEWSYTGTHDGPFEHLAASGRSFEFRGASLFELEGDEISRCVDYWDLGYLVGVLQ